MDKTKKALIERILELCHDEYSLAKFGYIKEELPDISPVELVSLFEKIMFNFFRS